MKENKYIRFLIFLIANLSALGIGVWLMNEGPRTDWYLSLNKAPWTPAGWVFGVAWTIIMVLFSVYMTKVSFQHEFLNKKVLILYVDQWILNVSWNYIFFNQHLTKLGLVVIALLWLLIGYFTFKYLKKVRWYTLFVLPYLIWMTIATSLNAYIVLNN
ncbi:TspO and MBR related proteins [Tenacibaculum mesophilum]|uniref:Tryptophan-rich sensory protein n=1 Tax=Tenacibaculum mesophilum TaxID=104268 RepID=A0ABM7CHZ8_9FLAO|nr:TspO/MBR family protein [Tenacibaculum mesophilum]AZJ33421.1 tryptophan-rich sensory protein [Tenacibaculum mesophilum]QFS28662.1 tryptophan-rich sensory protein [Tenacibaculum mesophilum]GFD81455.1 sensory protein TspO [Tenacibaculum sp. KUL118]SHF61301.1 TspO and MBR related proteins [Tenacibaculum mesophilum]